MLKYVHELIKRKTWINTLPKVGRKTMSKLFSNFMYFTESDVKREVRRMFSEISKDIQLEKTVFANLTKDTYGGSDFLMNHFWFENNLYRSSFKVINKLKFEKAKYIVLVDDFMGTGKTLIDELEILRNEIDLNDKKIIVITLVASEESISAIKKYKIEKGLSFRFHSLVQFKKAFLNGHIFKKPTNLVFYNDMCDQIGLNKNRLGFKNSEALTSFYYNTPNNTLGIFWSTDDGNNPYYFRHKKRYSLSSIQKKAKEHKPKNHNFDTDNKKQFQKILIIVYLCEKGLKNRKRIMKQFGLNFEQLTGIIKENLKHGYISITKKKVKLTDKGKQIVSERTYKYVKTLYKNRKN